MAPVNDGYTSSKIQKALVSCNDAGALVFQAHAILLYLQEVENITFFLGYAELALHVCRVLLVDNRHLSEGLRLWGRA